MRADGRKNDEMRKIKVTPGFIRNSDGSVLIELGNTRVICTAKFEEKGPAFLTGTGSGWITAEYSMLPGSTLTRKQRAVVGKPDNRGAEIQRLIGRSLRSVVNLKKLGEYTLWIDCDVIDADGGTRTTSITGGFIAMALAINKYMKLEILKENPIVSYCAAVSAGVVGGEFLLDLCYREDSSAKVDMNVVMNDKGEFIELQGTGEQSPFSREQFDAIAALASKGIGEIIEIQKKCIEL